MALLNKWFSKRRSHDKCAGNKGPEIGVKFAPEFTEDQLRVVFFRDSDSRGQRLLFDSSSVERVPLNTASSGSNGDRDTSATSKKAGEEAKKDEREASKPSSPKKNSSCPCSSRRKSAKKPEFVEITEGYGYKYLPSNLEFCMRLAEMAFGSVAMSFQGCTSKIHYIGGDVRTMYLSLVFPAPPARKKNWDWQHSSFSDASFEGSCNSSFGSLGDFGGEPSASTAPHNGSSSSSGTALSTAYPWCQFYVDPASNAAANGRRAVSVGPPSLASNTSLDGSDCVTGGGSGSGTSLHNVTSVGHESMLPGLVRPRYMVRSGSGAVMSVAGGAVVGGTLSRRATQESLNDGEREDFPSGNSSSSLAPISVTTSTSSHGCGKAAAKLALGLLINLGSDIPAQERLEWFILVHMRSLETLLWRLKTTFEMVYSHQKTPFVHSMYLATAEFKQSVVDLYVIPRLSRPLWTVISAAGDDGWSDFAREFIPEFFAVLERYDSKETNFFVSTILTAVLTHHLGWTAPFLKELSDADDGTRLATGGSPVQCQMDDINGLLGFPPRSARTLIAGLDAALVSRFLSILSFFVRFNVVKERTFVSADESVPLSDPTSRLAPPSSTSRGLVAASWSEETLLAAPSTATSACPSLTPSPCQSTTSLLSPAIRSLTSPDASPKLKRTRSFATRLSDRERLYPDLAALRDENGVLENTKNLSADVTATAISLNAPIRCHRKTRSADLSAAARGRTVVTRATILDSLIVGHGPRSDSGIEIVGDQSPSEHRRKKVEFVLGQNEKLELTPKFEKSEVVKEMPTTVPTIRIEKVAPVGRCSASPDTADEAVETSHVLSDGKVKETSQCSWSKFRSKFRREAPKVSVFRHKERPGDSEVKKFLRRASDPVSPSRCDKNDGASRRNGSVTAVGRCARFMSLQWNDAVEATEVTAPAAAAPAPASAATKENVKRSSFAPFSTPRLYPSLFTDGDDSEGGLERVAEETPEWALNEVPCPSATSLGMNSDPSWAPARTMFAGVGARFVSGVALSGVLFSQLSGVTTSSSSHQSKESSVVDLSDCSGQHAARASPSRSSSSSSLASSSASTASMSSSFLQAAPFSFLSSTSASSSSGVYSEHSLSSLSSASLSSTAFQRLLYTDLSASVRSEASLLVPAEIQPEAVCIIGDTSRWTVETVNSSRSGHWCFGSTCGHLVVTAPAVASMLESVAALAKAKVDHLTCLTFLENSLRELFLRSFALRDYLMNDTGLCDIRMLCEKLDLEVNDVPLLMSIASTHSPEVMRMYGLSFK